MAAISARSSPFRLYATDTVKFSVITNTIGGISYLPFDYHGITAGGEVSNGTYVFYSVNAGEYGVLIKTS